MNLLINRFPFYIKTDNSKTIIYFFKENNPLYFFRKKPTFLLNDFNNESLKEWLNDFKKESPKDENYIYFSFFEKSENQININLINNIKYVKLFVKERLIKFFLEQKLIVEPFKEGCDFCVYIRNNNENRYTRYDFVINENDISISIGSDDTFFINKSLSELSDNNKIIFNNLLIRYGNVASFIKDSQYKFQLKADFNERKKLNINSNPKFYFYNEHYNLIKKFVETYLSSFKDERLNVYFSFKKIDDTQIKQVAFNFNKMVFKNDQMTISTINGMKDYGPYFVPENIRNIKLLFIYHNTEAVNKLFTYFSRGYRQFPGLESYVGIPVQPFGKYIKYDENNIESIIQDIKEKLPDNNYDDLLAICMVPFDKRNATEEQSQIYYKIKEILLQKNIGSQFINTNNVFSQNFHFYLPNIAIAMLAKVGGIPWKLNHKDYNQLIIGFNLFRNNENKYIGSSIYFDNSGLLKKVDAFNIKNTNDIARSIKNSITEFQKNNKCNSLIIHYFKPPSHYEIKEIQNCLSKELNLNIPVAFVEINDTKTSTDICFDLDYVSLMPQSGIYIQLRNNEFLLFNNLRYWEKPILPIKIEEYPIKIKIYSQSNFFQYDELITQVYEFSRLYWKGLKQKSQPVTTLYSKLIAEYFSHFNNDNLSYNKTTNNTIWFI